ncbi:MAG: hypothetical protein ABW168_17500 [Sedimenticola sp.]
MKIPRFLFLLQETRDHPLCFPCNEFIKTRIEEGIYSDNDWSSLFEEPERTWCWEARSCDKRSARFAIRMTLAAG